MILESNICMPIISKILLYISSFSYNNLTKKFKREWYNFQIGTNEFLTEIFGEDEEDEDDSNQIADKNDQ